MRVLITQRPPRIYDPKGSSLLVGRVYDLPSELAAALIVEGCAECEDVSGVAHAGISSESSARGGHRSGDTTK